MKKLNNVLGLFDGISCGQVALKRARIKYSKYYASEVDKNAITVTQKNFPDTIQVGDVYNLKCKDLPKIDLLMGGSPCQGFSYAGKGLNFNDPRSKLFFEFVRMLKECKPKYFLFENVVMLEKNKKIITDFLGVEPIFINSKLVSAQDRKRLYWTNIPNVTQPKDKQISFAEISDDGSVCAAMRGRRIDKARGVRNDSDRSIPIHQYIECRRDNKTNCLTTVSKDNVAVKERFESRLAKEVTDYRFLSIREYELLQTLPLGYTDCVSETQRKKLIGNGWTVDVIAHILKGIK